MENSWWQCYLILFVGFVSVDAEADVDYELRVGGAYTDNVRVISAGPLKFVG